jgi:bifunctional polynucleotide phosphatase/kinase
MVVVLNGWKPLGPGGEAPPIAAFDLDGTLITPVRGRVRANDAADWQFRRFSTGGDKRSVPQCLAVLAEGGWRVAVLTNQSSRGRGGTAANDAIVAGIFKRLAAAITAGGGPDVLFIGATREGRDRKPMRGMWDRVLEASGRAADARTDPRDFYCGDAAGRPASAGVPKDFARSDAAFANNVGIGFLTPEKLFVGRDPRPVPALTRPAWREHPETPTDEAVARVVAVAREINAKLIVMVGFPGSGKTTLARRIAIELEADPSFAVSGDTFKTPAALERECTRAIWAGGPTHMDRPSPHTVVVDRTNMTRASRRQVVDLVARLNRGAPCLCVDLTTVVNEGTAEAPRLRPSDGPAWHRNCVRADGGGRFVPKVAYAALKKKTELVGDDEGFARVLRFPCFTPREDRRVYDNQVA